MTGDFRDPSEEMKRLLRRIEEIDEAQQAQLPQAQSLESERTPPVAALGDSGKPALQPRGKQVGLRVWGAFRRPGLARRTTIASIVAAVVAAILMVKMPAISI